MLAARLSEDPDVTVCLVEAGPSDVGDPNILPLSEWMHLLDSGYDWDYPVEPQEKGNSFMRHARAKVLGGCSSHNSCIAFWPPAECLDEWVDDGRHGLERRRNPAAGQAIGEQRRARRSRTRRPGPSAGRPAERSLRRGGARGGGVGRAADGGVQPRRDGAQRRGLVPDQRRRGRHPHVDARTRTCIRSWTPARTSRCAPTAGFARSCSTTPTRRPGCATSGPTSPATTRCRRGARSSSRRGPSTRRSC